MNNTYTYDWYIQQFGRAKNTAENFITSSDEDLFLTKPSNDGWSAAECYGHLITFGHLYLKNMIPAIAYASATTNDLQQSFEPRWITAKVISAFEPPYNIGFKTFQSMKPNFKADHDPEKLLEDYLGLQNLLIEQLNSAKETEIHLNKVKVPHPVFSIIKMMLSECFAVIEVHQRRHQWQTEQTLNALQS